ncbi:Histone deacetylase hda1 [Haplosporangium sp. Z 27]|nr:Histone deacetylase hda1 [Haplosporangium sp. Z 27]
MPIVLEFAPDFVLVSAGFDAAKGDHIGQMLVTPPAYGHMTHMLKSLAGGKIILALEGGYNLDSIAVSGLACAQALLNDPIEPLGPITPNALCVQTIHEVIEVQSRYWKGLPQVYIDSDEEPVEGRLDVSINKVLGVYREEYLRERYDMIKMPKLESENGKGTQFLENVYCTQQTYNSKPLYIFVHELGEFCTRIMSTNNIIRPEKSFLMDSVSHYVDHIIGSDNELIDIVQPYQPTCEEEKVALKEKLSGLLLEIWDSYVATTGYTGRRIILLATGFGCHGMVAFMNERQREVSKYVSCVTMVPGDDSLPMVTKKMGSWYLENSFVILTNDHPFWDRVQKPNNRNGNLIRSDRPSGRLSDLLNHLRKRIFEDIDRKLEGLPSVNPDDDSDLESTKDGPVPMETDPNPTTTAPPTQQNGKLSNQFNGDIKPIPTSPMEESQLTPIPRIVHTRASSPLPSSSASSVKNEDQGVVTTKATTKMEELSPNQSPRSYPGSPLLNGSSILRPISQPLVDRPSVVGQQHRSQPYPSPNGRPYNSPVMNPSTSSSPSSSSAGPLPTHLKGSTPQGRGSDPKLTGLGPGSGGEPTEHQIRVAEQQQQQFLEEQRHLEKQRLHQQQQQQQQEQFQQQSRHPQERPDIRGGHPYPPYQGGGGSGGDKRIPRSSGPGEHYAPTPSSNGTAVSPANGSPHAPHSSIKPQSHPPQSQHQQQTGPHHPPGFGGVSQGNGSYRQGPPPQSMGPSSGSSAAPSPSSSSFETMHHHRGSYSSQGPPAPVSGPPPMSGPPPVSGPPPISGPTPVSGPPPSNGQQQHHGPGSNSNFRNQPGWSQQQQQHQQPPPHQQHMPPPNRAKRGEPEPDPYGPPSISRHQHPSQQQQQHHHNQQQQKLQQQEMERMNERMEMERMNERMEIERMERLGRIDRSERHRAADMERQRWEMEQARHQQQQQQRMDQRLDRGYEMRGHPPPPSQPSHHQQQQHRNLQQQQQQQHGHGHGRHPSQGQHPHHLQQPPHHPHHHQQQHYEQMQERRSVGMAKQQHMQHPH